MGVKVLADFGHEPIYREQGKTWIVLRRTRFAQEQLSAVNLCCSRDMINVQVLNSSRGKHTANSTVITAALTAAEAAA
jgi:hypothetical protein